MSARFEKVSRFADVDLPMPVRATTGAAGYDFTVAEDTIVPSIWRQQLELTKVQEQAKIIIDYDTYANNLTLKETEQLVKRAGCKMTLVPTGMKCYLDEGTYLELSVRSSTPLKSWLMLANGVGIIDRDYYNSAESEGHIYFQLVNLAPWDIQLRKGDRIGQGIIKPYLTTEDDNCSGLERAGGFGSSNE